MLVHSHVAGRGSGIVSIETTVQRTSQNPKEMTVNEIICDSPEPALVLELGLSATAALPAAQHCLDSAHVCVTV